MSACTSGHETRRRANGRPALCESSPSTKPCRHVALSTRSVLPVPQPTSPDQAKLDRVPNPHPDTHYVARFTMPEFNSTLLALLGLSAATFVGMKMTPNS